MLMTFLEVSKAAYDYSWKASNVICDSVGVGCWYTPKGIENETDRYAYQRFIDDSRNSRTDKKLYNMVGFINWGEDGIPHYFLSSEAFKSLDKHLKEMQRVYAEKGWDYDLPILDLEEFGNFDDIDSSHLDISMEDYPVSKEVLGKAAVSAYNAIKGF